MPTKPRGHEVRYDLSASGRTIDLPHQPRVSAVGQTCPRSPISKTCGPTPPTALSRLPSASSNLYKGQSGGLYHGALQPGHCRMALCAAACSAPTPSSIHNTERSPLSDPSGPGAITRCSGPFASATANGVQFDFNYTWSKSIDLASIPENNALNPGVTSQDQQQLDYQFVVHE